MEGLRYLAKNTGLLALGQFGTKLLSFFLVPLYTYVLTTVEYGTYDFMTSTISLLIPLMTLNICDAALRFPLDKGTDRQQIFAISFRHFIISIIFGAAFIGFNRIFNIIDLINQYPIFFFLLFIATGINGIMNCFARGIDCVKDVAVSGVICSIVIIGLNLLFLLPLHMGLIGFFLANIIGSFVQSIYLFIAIKGWKYLIFTSIDKKLHHDMLRFSEPLMLNNISWWVNGVSNRYIITWLCGVAANGIYAVSYKIPSILVMLQGIFSQAWTLSAVKDFDKDDKNGFFSKMYASYNVSMVLACSILIMASRIMAKFLYQGEFFEAWKYVPFLLISAIFGALSGYVGGIFAAVKDTKIFGQTSILGAVVNLALTIVLVWKVGVIGAAISALVSNSVIWAIRIRVVKRYIHIRLNLLLDIIGYLLLCVQTIILFIWNDNIQYWCVEILIFIVILLINKKILKTILGKITSKIHI